MSPCRTFFTFSRLAVALAALWLCGVGTAWAGDGADLASLNQLLSDPTTGLCKIFNMSTCPQLPTITQGILEVAALANSPPEIVAAQNSIAPGYNVTAGNPAAVPPDDLLPLNSNSSPALQDLLSTLTPLAFASQKSGTGTAVATQLYAPNADTFLYAVGVSSLGEVESGANLTSPDTMYFFYDDLFRVAQTFTKGQIVAKFSFPLTVLENNGTENPAVMTTLTITSCANGLASCFTAKATGNFLSNTGSPLTVDVDASQLGIQFALVFSKSPTSTQSHAIFEVAVPLLVTGACVGSDPLCLSGQTFPGPNTDPAYFYFFQNGKPGPINTATYTAFGTAGDYLGHTPAKPNNLPVGSSIGLAPTAAPLCTSTTCPPPPGTVPAGPVTFALCAALPDNTNGPAARLRPAVGAFYAIAASGETLLSAPLTPSIPIVCPAL